MRTTAGLLATWLLAAPVSAQEPFAALTTKVDAVFNRFSKPTSPGCSLAVTREGRVIYARGYGMADLDHDIVITPSTVFHVASVSKQFTAAAIALLEQDGKLSLDDDVRKHVPELPDLGPRITIRQLLHHTSGLRDQWDLLGLAGWRYSRDLITDEDVLRVMANQKALNFAPGSEFLYCNTGYTLLATIVARVSGQSFRQFTTDRLFKPLGMTRTRFRDDFGEIVKDQAYGYVPAADTFRLSVTNFDTAGATSLLTTVEDMARWDQNFFDARVGGPGFLERILTRGRLNSGEEIPYAFGLTHGSHRGLPTVGHGGSDAGYRADYLRFPGEKLSVIALCNVSTSNPGELTRKVADVVLADRLGPPEVRPSDDRPAVTVSDKDLARYAGLYWQRGTDNYRKISTKNGALGVGFGDAPIVLKAVSPNRFAALTSDYVFEPDATGRMRLTESPRSAQNKPVVFEAVETFTPTPAETASFVGTYRSEEIEPIYRIARQEGRLVVRRLKFPPQTLEPLTRDVFRTAAFVIRFSRDATGRVTGCELSTGRVRGVRLVRDQDGK
jgi:CubicO group peptidase (beta-lactamase class C family)